MKNKKAPTLEQDSFIGVLIGIVYIISVSLLSNKMTLTYSYPATSFATAFLSFIITTGVKLNSVRNNVLTRIDTSTKLTPSTPRN